MADFRCSGCGRAYQSADVLGICPHCSAWGKKDPKCLCGVYRAFGGRRTGVVANWNAECPVHTQDPTKKSKT